jgi:hypothetical protein
LRALPLALVAVAACSSHDPGPSTIVEFDEVTNLGYACGGPLARWSVTCRETSEGTDAMCQQPIQFRDLAPNATYTFDIQGFDAQNNLCWQGACTVDAAGGVTTLADCSHSIQHLCNL